MGGGLYLLLLLQLPKPNGELGSILSKGRKMFFAILASVSPLGTDEHRAATKPKEKGAGRANTNQPPPKKINRDARRIDESRGACKGASFLGPGQGSLGAVFPHLQASVALEIHGFFSF